MGTDERIAELTACRQPFVHATVVRAQSPTSARPGDHAVVLADGTIEGFVGGQCTRNSVRTTALDALRDGQAVLLRVLPEGAPTFPEGPGARVVVNPCLSGGALEIFLEPKLPAPQLFLVGENPTVDAVAALAKLLGLDVVRADSGGPPDGMTAVVIATLGGDEAAEIRAALDAGVGYIGLVASATRGAAVLGELELDPDTRARVHTPAGLPIGARGPAEIALSILAEIVREMRLAGLGRAAPVPVPETAVDPVCGMTVTMRAEAPHVEADGGTVWFCGPGCRDRYLRERAR
ncbi:XdhC family protein [Rhodococcus sp. NPDC004095]